MQLEHILQAHGLIGRGGGGKIKTSFPHHQSQTLKLQ